METALRTGTNGLLGPNLLSVSSQIVFVRCVRVKTTDYQVQNLHEKQD